MTPKKIVLEFNNEQIEFSYKLPLFLGDCTGIYDLQYENTTDENYRTDGTTVKGSKQSARFIEINFTIAGDYTFWREHIYSLLPAGKLGTLFYFDEIGGGKKIENCNNKLNTFTE